MTSSVYQALRRLTASLSGESDEHSLGKILETDKFTVYAEALGPTHFLCGLPDHAKRPRRNTGRR